MSGEDLLARLRLVQQEPSNRLAGKFRVDFDSSEIDTMIDALLRPEVRHSCASTSNYPAMAERALRLIERNGIRESEAIEGITHLVDCAGLEHATKALEDDDAVPF
jgi:hypothetical protein